MSVTRKGAATGITMVGPSLSSFDFEILETSEPNITDPATTVQTTEDDRVYEETSAGAYEDNRQLSTAGTFHPNIPTYESLDESIATVDSGGLVTQVSNGTVGVLVKFPWLTRRTDLTLDNSSAATKIQIDWTLGSWGEDIADRVDNAIAGLEASETMEIYSSLDGHGQSATRDTGCWLYQYDTTCVSPWNDQRLTKMAGTLITARHVLFAAHYQPNVGTKLLFVSNGNTVYEREIMAIETHPSYSSSSIYPDLAVAVLDSDLPSPAITPARVLPDSWANYVTIEGYRMPTVCIDQENKALIIDAYSIDDTTRSTRRTFLTTPSNSQRLLYYEKPISGDSGSPVMLLTNAAPILLTVLTSSSMGTAIVAYKADINTMIGAADTAAGVATGYTLTEANLTSFTDFSAP